MVIFGRTDLAAEARQLWQNCAEETTRFNGVRAEEETLYGYPVTAVEILDEDGEKALGKPRGRYYTLQLPPRFPQRGQDFERAVDALAALIRRCLPPSPPAFSRISSPEAVYLAALSSKIRTACFKSPGSAWTSISGSAGVKR